MRTRPVHQPISFFTRAKNWFKKNPLLACGIIAGLVVGGIFTGGIILAPLLAPLAINIGTYCAAIACGTLGAAIIGKLTINNDGSGLGAFATVGAAVGGAYGGFALVCAAPIVGIVLAGAAAAVVGGAIISAAASTLRCLFRSCFGKTASRKIDSRLSPQKEPISPSAKVSPSAHKTMYTRVPELAVATHRTPLMSETPDTTVSVNTTHMTLPSPKKADLMQSPSVASFARSYSGI